MLSQNPPPAYIGSEIQGNAHQQRIPQTNSSPQMSRMAYSLSNAIDAAQQQPASLIETNPYRRTRQTSPQAVAAPAVRSITSETPLQYPKPQRVSDAAKPVDLHRLDGTPYPGNEAERKSRKVKVAKDMYDGQMPPEYRPEGSESVVPRSRMPTNVTQNREHANDPNKLGKEKTAVSPVVASASASNQYRSVSDGAQSSGPPNSGCSSCTKCGRHRRPGSLNLPQQPFYSADRPGPLTAPLPTQSNGSQLPSPAQFGLSYTTEQKRMQLPRLQSGSGPVSINVEPPTASTAAPFSAVSRRTTRDEAPLVVGKKGKEPGMFRGSSISSMIRSLSRRTKKKPSISEPQSPLPSQQLKRDGDKSPDQIISMISSAIRESEGTDNKKRTPGRDPVDRPGSPFSFVDKVDETDAFEMSDMRKSKLLESRNSWEQNDEMFLPKPLEVPKTVRSVSDNTHGLGLTIPRDERLDISPDQRPGITRFKSLRAGVNRAASEMGRSKSLKRLGSVKKVPQLWYRSDMALEGANSESVIGYAY